MKTLKSLLVLLLIITVVSSCKEDDDTNPTPTISGTVMQPSVGGSTQPNQVFVDLSTATQSSADRGTWNMGFYSGTEFRVMLNSSIEMMAYKTTMNDMSLVTASDTVGLAEKLSLDAIFASITSPTPAAWLADAINWVDNPNGDLSETAIDDISAVSTDNKVYIINSGKDANGMSGNWYKIKVNQEPGGYSLEVALINVSVPTIYSISKNTDYNYSYFSFVNGPVLVAPIKTDWDIAFTTYTDYANFGFNVPYFYQDYVIQNRNGVEAVQVTFAGTDELVQGYDAFTINSTSGMNFRADINVIGSEWREVATPQPGTVTGVFSDRMYVVKDAAGDYYKIVFTDMTSDTGDRGFPEFVFKKL